MCNRMTSFFSFSWVNGSARWPNWQWHCSVYETPDIISYITDGDNYPQSWWQRHGRGYWFDVPSLVITSHQIVMFALVTLSRGLWQMSDVCSPLVSSINSTLLWPEIIFHTIASPQHWIFLGFSWTTVNFDCIVFGMQNHKFNKRVCSV